MAEKQQDLGRIGVDGSIFKKANSICDGYYMDDPLVTKEMAQQVAISALQGSRILDAKFKTSFAKNQFAIERLQDLGVDPETLEVIEGKK